MQAYIKTELDDLYITVQHLSERISTIQQSLETRVNVESLGDTVERYRSTAIESIMNKYTKLFNEHADKFISEFRDANDKLSSDYDLYRVELPDIMNGYLHNISKLKQLRSEEITTINSKYDTLRPMLEHV